MSKEIVMNVGPGETRVAILEDGRLVELSFERNGTTKNAGNIYKALRMRRQNDPDPRGHRLLV